MLTESNISIEHSSKKSLRLVQSSADYVVPVIFAAQTILSGMLHYSIDEHCICVLQICQSKQPPTTHVLSCPLQVIALAGQGCMFDPGPCMYMVSDIALEASKVLSIKPEGTVIGYPEMKFRLHLSEHSQQPSFPCTVLHIIRDRAFNSSRWVHGHSVFRGDLVATCIYL